MPKFFVMSDIHGFYDEMKSALDESGFDENNPEHWLISCGDEWDRGPKPIEVMRFLSGLERKIIIRGNHTILFEDLCERGYYEWYDSSNGTLGTVKKIGCYSSMYTFDLCCIKALERTKKYRNNMVNYFETKNHIFVHSWIPLIIEDDYPKYYTRDREYHFNPNWRNATEKEWEQAMWGNPFKIAEQGLNQTDKTIVFGHWHCSTGWAKAEGRSEFGEDATFEPYFGDGFISIDACTAHSGKCNVVVIEDEFLEGSDESC